MYSFLWLIQSQYSTLSLSSYDESLNRTTNVLHVSYSRLSDCCIKCFPVFCRDHFHSVKNLIRVHCTVNTNMWKVKPLKYQKKNSSNIWQRHTLVQLQYVYVSHTQRIPCCFKALFDAIAIWNYKLLLLSSIHYVHKIK